MPSEDQLKSQMQAAIQKKKNDLVGARRDSPADDAPTPVSKPEPEITSELTKIKIAPPPLSKVDVVHPAIYQPVSSSKPQVVATDPNPAVSSNAELTRSFFGRPIRVAIYDKKVYFCVPDVLNVSDDPDKLERYQDLHQSSQKSDFLEAIILRMNFPSPNGGHDKLDAATAENLTKIISKLELKFPEPIEKWLSNVTENLTVLL